MENTGEIMTASVPVNIAAVAAPTVDVFESGVEMDARVTLSEPDIGSEIEAGVDVADSPHIDALGEEPIISDGKASVEDEQVSVNDEPEADEVDRELEDAREELRKIEEDEKENANEIDEKRNENFREQLEMLNATIRLLEIQRDALREQLGFSLSKVIYKVIEMLIVNPSINESEERGAEPVDGPTQAWRDNAKGQLRNIEKKIFELKAQRKQLVASHMN